MIKTKSDLKYYLDSDKKALGIDRRKPRIFSDEIWKYEIILRKREYYQNQRDGLYNKLLRAYYMYRHHKMSLKLGLQIPPNVCDAGLHINHFGLIVISANAKIGKNFDVHQGVNIGINTENDKAPIIGDNVFCGPGVKIYGDVHIADNIAISAGAVVNRSFDESNITVGGELAKVINPNKGNPFIPKN